MSDIIPYPDRAEPAALLAWGRNLVQSLSLKLKRLEAGSSSGSSGSAGTGSALPSGTLLATVALVAPDGWVKAEGQTVPTIDAPALAAALGGRFNTGGEPEGTFRVPDGRGRVPMGSVAAYGGAMARSLAFGNLPAGAIDIDDPGHTHGFVGDTHTHSVNDPGHIHGASSIPKSGGGAPGIIVGTVAGNLGAAVVVISPANTGVAVEPAETAGVVQTATTGLSVDLGGAGEALDTTPSFFGVTWIIKL